MKLIKTCIFLFLFTFATHAFGKSNEYYQMVITNVLTNCKTDECRKSNFEQGGIIIATNNKVTHRNTCLQIKEIIRKYELIQG